MRQAIHSFTCHETGTLLTHRSVQTDMQDSHTCACGRANKRMSHIQAKLAVHVHCITMGCIHVVSTATHIYTCTLCIASHPHHDYTKGAGTCTCIYTYVCMYV